MVERYGHEADEDDDAIVNVVCGALYDVLQADVINFIVGVVVVTHKDGAEVKREVGR